MLVNIVGTNELLKYAYNEKIERFIFISTGEIYGEMGKEIETFSENDSGYINITSPRACYPSSKRAAETLCVSYEKQFDVDIVIARLCHTYGPNATSTDNRATVQFLHNVLDDKDIIMKSRGLQLRSYIYIADCASGILSVLINGKRGEAYNIANPDSRITILDFAYLTAELSDKNVRFELSSLLNDDEQTPITRAVLDSHKIEALGWKSQFRPREGIGHTLKILKDLKNTMIYKN